MFKVIKWAIGIFIGLIILGSIIESNKTPEEKAADQARREAQHAEEAQKKQQEAAQEMATLPSYTAGDLARAYNENSVSADQAFKGKKFKVSGIITDINTDLFGNPNVLMNGGVNQFMQPQFSFDKDDVSTIANLKKGMKVTFICTGKGDIAKTPMSGDCVLI